MRATARQATACPLGVRDPETELVRGGRGIMIDMRFIDPPLDDLRSEDPESPAYEVTFWERLSEPTELPEHQRGFLASVCQLTDADVKQVIAWADTRVGPHRTYQIKVAVASRDDGLNLVWLFGDNPAAGDLLSGR